MKKSDCIRRLKNLLLATKEKVDLISANKDEIFIFGAGNTTKLHEKCFEAENIKPAGFLDNDPKKQGTTPFLTGGGTVSSPSILQGRKDILVLICSAQINVRKAVASQLKQLGLSFLTVDEYVFSKRTAEILKCVELIEDEESVEIYCEIIASRLMGNYPTENFIYHDQYFALPKFFEVAEKEVFVDCGAFVGDSVEKYIWAHDGTFGKIFAFEPDIINFRAMQYRIERLNKEWAFSEDKICAVNAGVGVRTAESFIEGHNGTGTRISEKTDSTNDSIKIYALDDFFANQKIDFLKADIESFEMDMLQGAEKIIRRDLPKIAICIYHNVSDMYRILLWLADLNLDYRFSIRHHQSKYADLVLYAYH